jgi:hypothetical protein
MVRTMAVMVAIAVATSLNFPQNESGFYQETL